MRPVAVRMIFFAPLLAFLLAVAPVVRGRAMVAADHALAAEAGAEVLGGGGNAVDAAVAAALSGGVVQPAGSGLGGGGFAVVRLPGADPVVLDFREVAPARATRDQYRTPGGGVDGAASKDGPSAVAVPAEARGLAELVRRYGRLDLAAVAAPAIRQARDGFPVGRHLARALGRTPYPQVRALFTVGGRIATEGDVVRRPVLASTLERWAATGGEVVHAGEGAAAVAAIGGPTVEDLAGYRCKDRVPLVGRYRGHTVITMPPPSSGGVALLQLLGVLEGYDLRALGRGSADYVHLLAEAMKHAYSDRAHHLGDPDFVEVPLERLLSAERIDGIQAAIRPTRAFAPDHYGPLLAPPADAGTAHVSAVDAEGGAAALTTTINNPFGSGVVVDALGIVLNDQMDDFAAAPGVPNAFGLVGAAANEITPGKRPLSSMTPTIVLDADGRVVVVIGASGGSQIISSTLQVLVAVLDFGLDPQEAVTVPRMHHQWVPDVLVVEPGHGPEVVRELEARGHHVTQEEHFSAVQVLVRQPDGSWAGGADPRKGGWPAASASASR